MATQARPVRGGRKPAAAAATAKAVGKAIDKVVAKKAPAATPDKVGLKELGVMVHNALPLVAKATVDRVVEEVFSAMSAAYANGSVVNIKDFGKLAIQDRPARVGRNPQTGESVQIAAKRVPKFTFAKALKELA